MSNPKASAQKPDNKKDQKPTAKAGQKSPTAKTPSKPQGKK